MVATAVRAASYVATGYLCRVARTCHLYVAIHDGDTLSLRNGDSFLPDLIPLLKARPVVFPFWNAHSLLIIAAYLASSDAVREHLRDINAASDDTIGGRITSEMFGRIGIKSRRIAFSDAVRRLEDIRDTLKERTGVAIAADSHGPYRQISPGMARFAKSYHGIVTPISSWCNRSFALFRRIGMLAPLPACTIVLGVGKAIDLRDTTLPLSAVREMLQISLERLEADIRTAGARGQLDCGTI
jgi:lysophospholipid acyltransferase (LPLAT)-like uncharacterized protein